MSRVFCVIPARGGSQRVPNKNIRKVGEKTLIGHAITAARASSTIDEFIVSTDSEEIQTVAEVSGAKVPFLRPEELANDMAELSDVVTHALEWARANHFDPDIICVLLPTVPLRQATDVDQAIDQLENTDGTSVVSVSKYDTPPLWAVNYDNGYLEEYFERGMLWATDGSIERSQDLPELLHPNGAVFASYVDSWDKYQTFYQPQTVGSEMPAERSIDIDEPFDLKVARGLCLVDKQAE